MVKLPNTLVAIGSSPTPSLTTKLDDLPCKNRLVLTTNTMSLTKERLVPATLVVPLVT